MTIDTGEDCYDRALPDEPTFTLLARDPHAPDAVRSWAYARERGIQRGVYPESDRTKVKQARANAREMDRWRAANDGAWRDKETE